MRRPDEGLMSLDQVIAVAEKVDPLHHCDEPVILHAVGKGPNVWRPIMISGPRRRAAQLLCADVLTAGLVPDPINYLVRGRGIEVASDRIMELIKQHEMTTSCWQTSRTFLGRWIAPVREKCSPCPDRLYCMLCSSLPAAGTGSAERVLLSVLFSPIGHQTSSRSGPAGTPPGLAHLPASCGTDPRPNPTVVAVRRARGRLWDDIALGARSAKEADGLMQALEEALKSHPAGPFRLSRKVIGRVCGRFDFLKYRYKAIPACYGGGIRRVPSGKSYERFEERVMMITAEYPISESEDRVDSYTGHWVRSFKRWEPHALSLFRLEGTKFRACSPVTLERAKKAKESSNGPTTEPSKSE